MAVRKPTKARSELKPPAQKLAVRQAGRQAVANPQVSNAKPQVSTVKAGAKASVSHLEAAVARLETTVAELKATRDQLELDLAAARKQIVALEQARLDAINRIDWVIDSLETFAQK